MRFSRHWVSRSLVTLSLMTGLSGCDHISRSGFRKLSHYEPERFAQLDLEHVRVAFEHRSQFTLNLEVTKIGVMGGFDGAIHELHHFAPSVEATAVTVLPGLPPAKKGRSWTLVGLKRSDLELAAEVNQTFWEAVLSEEKAEPDQEDKRKFREWIQRRFPSEGTIVDKKGDYNFEVFVMYRIDTGKETPKKSSTDVWLLLDPKDGYFQIIDED
jgi:hypothetical protein